MKGVLIGLAVVIVVAVGAMLLINRNDNAEDQSLQTQSQTSQTQTQTQSTQIQNGQVSVSISNFKFPDKIKISKGSTVTWTNQDSDEHNVASDADSPQTGLDGPLLAKGASFSFTFNEVGVYNYHCTPHPFMTGTVEVVEGNATEVTQ